MSLAHRLLHGAWQAASTPGWRIFRRALETPHGTQERLLRTIVEDNRETWFGRRHGFGAIRGVEDFRRKVPLSTWRDYEGPVARIRHGERGVLTAEPVIRLVPSSGSSTARKLIPWTAELGRRFQAGIAPWIVELFRRRPGLKGGPGYWSVSPAIPGKAEAGEIPVGFDDDRAYLGAGLGRLVGWTLAVPPEVRHLASADAFYDATALFLLARADLRLLSVWHSSFLERLFDRIAGNWPRLLGDLERGASSTVVADAGERRTLDRLAARLGPRPRRARRLAAAGAGAGPCGWWSELALVSAWADGPAELAAAALARRLPGVEIQPKGLVATEGIVTLPFGRERPLAVASHFFEFIDGGGGTRLTDQLEAGASYSVVLTNGGGLYRYRLRDRVRVTGRLGATPTLRFEGKEAMVSDQRGEKLDELFVERALRRAFAEVPGPGLGGHAFVLLAPEGRPDAAMRYCLYLEPAGEGEPAVALGPLAAALERRLCENPHYELCRRLGQLEPVRGQRVRAGAAAFLRRRRDEGLKLGDVKPSWLSPATGWSSWFARGGRTPR